MTIARINARLDQASAKKLDVLRRRTGLSTTAILRAALEHLYDKETQGAGGAASILKQTGFVGCAQGPEDLSVHYKQALGRSLDGKSG